MKRPSAPYATLAWQTAAQLAKIYWFAPIVVSERLAGIAAGGTRPSARQQREVVDMIAEKQLAAMQVAGSVWLAAAQAQQQAWIAAWGAGRPVPGWQDTALTATTARKLGRALSPVARRVKSNADRLSKARRRRLR
jgi:hypothetical protein